eukprot:g1549.t1
MQVLLQASLLILSVNGHGHLAKGRRCSANRYTSCATGGGTLPPNHKGGAPWGEKLETDVAALTAACAWQEPNHVNVKTNGKCKTAVAEKHIILPSTGELCGSSRSNSAGSVDKPWSSTRENFITTGNIVAGQTYDIEVFITAPHAGFHTFALCPDEVTVDCWKDKKNWLKIVSLKDTDQKVVADYHFMNDCKKSKYFSLKYSRVNNKSNMLISLPKKQHLLLARQQALRTWFGCKEVTLNGAPGPAPGPGPGPGPGPAPGPGPTGTCTGAPCDDKTMCRSSAGYCGSTDAYCNAKSTWTPKCTGSQTPSPSPSGTTKTPSPSPSGTTKTPSPSPSGTTKTPSPSPSGTTKTPSPSPSGTTKTPSPSPSGTTKTPSPSPSGTTKTPSPSPNTPKPTNPHQCKQKNVLCQTGEECCTGLCKPTNGNTTISICSGADALMFNIQNSSQLSIFMQLLQASLLILAVNGHGYLMKGRRCNANRYTSCATGGGTLPSHKGETIEVDAAALTAACSWQDPAHVHPLNAGKCRGGLAPKKIILPSTGQICGSSYSDSAGTVGTAWSSPRAMFPTTGNIVAGSTYDIELFIAAPHAGFHTFALCPDEADAACWKDKSNWLKIESVQDNEVVGEYHYMNDCTFIAICNGSKPNILFIMADQMRWDVLSEKVTPNLISLAESGHRFSNAYSSTPTCTPARAAILTGRSPWFHGMLSYGAIAKHYPQGEYVSLLSQSGYSCHSVGKNHFLNAGETPKHAFNTTMLYDGLGNGINQGEFDDYDAWFQKQMPGLDPLKGIDDWNSWESILYPYEPYFHPTAWTGRTAVSFLENVPKDNDKPFFLKVSFHRPHSPYDPPMEYYEQIDDDAVGKPKVGGNWDALFKNDLEHCGPAFKDAWCGEMPANATFQSRKSYLANVKFVDEQVGLILKKLEELKLDETTFILFTADHGDGQGDHYHWRKGFPYEFSSHVPMMARLPKTLNQNETLTPSSSVIDNPVELRDLFPTFLDVAGTNTSLIPSNLNGSSLLALIANQKDGYSSPSDSDDHLSSSWRKWIDLEHGVVYNTTVHWNALTDGKMKYIYRAFYGDEQLFNLTADPYEMRSLHSDESYQSELLLWRQRLVQQFINEQRGENWVKDGKLVQRTLNKVYSPYYPKNTQIM